MILDACMWPEVNTLYYNQETVNTSFFPCTLSFSSEHQIPTTGVDNDNTKGFPGAGELYTATDLKGPSH